MKLTTKKGNCKCGEIFEIASLVTIADRVQTVMATGSSYFKGAFSPIAQVCIHQMSI